MQSHDEMLPGGRTFLLHFSEAERGQNCDQILGSPQRSENDGKFKKIRETNYYKPWGLQQFVGFCHLTHCDWKTVRGLEQNAWRRLTENQFLLRGGL